MPEPLSARAAALLDALPQTQCARCGWPDCAAYARAMDAGQAAPNRCAPGGAQGVARLAALLGQPVQALDPSCGAEAPRHVVWIDETWCIGCTLCIKACPVDAIIGTNRRMHTVIESACTGCDLCLPVCPVDCLHCETADTTRTGWAAWPQALAEQARQRYAWHRWRLERQAREHALALQTKAEMKGTDLAAHSQHTDPAVLDKKRAVIQAALERARSRRATLSPMPPAPAPRWDCAGPAQPASH